MSDHIERLLTLLEVEAVYTRPSHDFACKAAASTIRVQAAKIDVLEAERDRLRALLADVLNSDMAAFAEDEGRVEPVLEQIRAALGAPT